MTGMQPLHPRRDCNGRIELVAYQESGGAGLLGMLTKMPCTSMLASQQCGPTTHFLSTQFKTTRLSCHNETFLMF